MCGALGVRADISAAQTQPVPDNPIPAQTSLGINLKTRCPDLRIADEGVIAVIVFWLPAGGGASHISIKSSSGSSALDSAAIRCVSRLRFASATRLGDGEPIDSWQQIAFRWAEQGNASDTRAGTSQNPLSGASRTSEPIAGAPPGAARDEIGGQPNSVIVHVCVDAAGKLKQDPTIVHSSGNASLDQAAIRIAASGSPYYRPDTWLNGAPVSGCAQLAIKFDTK
ncbi:MAG TPA: TonB family protein [Steroidobacteraceae bacterium]|jgi:TonB family protein